MHGVLLVVQNVFAKRAEYVSTIFVSSPAIHPLGSEDHEIRAHDNSSYTAASATAENSHTRAAVPVPSAAFVDDVL